MVRAVSEMNFKLIFGSVFRVSLLFTTVISFVVTLTFGILSTFIPSVFYFGYIGAVTLIMMFQIIFALVVGSKYLSIMNRSAKSLEKSHQNISAAFRKFSKIVIELN